MGDLPESEFPLRLIDVQSTLRSEGGLCFHSGQKDWNFYIISHTWSRAIKELSEYIGEKINRGVKMGTEESMREYNDAFQNADLRSKEGYRDLRKFLEVLMEELDVGEKGNPIRIWFDVICINQEDSEEKSREIRRMAAYYKHSKGCYVLTHGVGQGYHLWPRQDQEDNDLISLPRWFTRVWTLQELVLPKKVMFLVAGFSESTATWANQYIENHGPRLCDCWLSSSSVNEASNILIWREHRHGDLSGELRVAELHESVMRGADELSSLVFDPLGLMPQTPAVNLAVDVFRRASNGLIDMANDYISKNKTNIMANLVNSNHGWQADDDSFTQGKFSSGGRGVDVRCECDSTSEPRKVKSGAMNFVESAAYFVLLVMDSQDIGSPHSTRKGSVLINLLKMLKLRQRLANMENGEEFAAMLEALDERMCTNEEDRVLSIMGLLGVKDSQNMKQLRTGKTLKEQLVSVARLMDHDKLMKLVVASSDRPHFFDGMSWAPVLSRDPFAGSPHSYNRPVTRVFDPTIWYQIPRVQHSVHSIEVSVDGLLNLKCKLAHARLIPDPGTTAGHLGSVGAGITPHLPYCGHGCGRIHVSSHAITSFLLKQNSQRHHLGSLPCSQCCDLASLFVPNLGEFYHAMVQYELQVDGRTLGVPIHLDAHYFTNAFTMYLRGTMYCDHGEAAYIQLPISPSRHFEQFLMNSFLQQTIPRKVKRCHGPAPYFVPIEVSLLLLGSSCDGKRRVAMVCIGEQHRLHRIGLFHFSAAVGDAIFADTPHTTCSVGSIELDFFLERLLLLQKPKFFKSF